MINGELFVQVNQSINCQHDRRRKKISRGYVRDAVFVIRSVQTSPPDRCELLNWGFGQKWACSGMSYWPQLESRWGSFGNSRPDAYIDVWGESSTSDVHRLEFTGWTWTHVNNLVCRNSRTEDRRHSVCWNEWPQLFLRSSVNGGTLVWHVRL